MLRLTLIPSLLLSTAALADAPSVTTDIAPVHGLVSMVMGDLGTPTLLVGPGASPHGYALRPSQAASLQDADAVFWIGHALAPWLEGPLDTLASDATVVELLEVAGTVTHDFRMEAVFAPDHHDDHDNHNDHDDHEDGHDNHGDHDDHEDGHDHEGIDPHAWLDPENARTWIGAIAATLAELDPENAPIYHANATRAEAEITNASSQIADRLTPLADRRFVVFHDAFQYFENRFDLTSAGAISMSDASSPSAARITEIQAAVDANDVICIFSEPQFNPSLVSTVARATELNIGVIDPLGTTLDLGPTFYPALIHSVADSVETCLSLD